MAEKKIRRALQCLAVDPHLGRIVWDSDLRLGELNRRERHRLVDELIAEAPKSWSGRA